MGLCTPTVTLPRYARWFLKPSLKRIEFTLPEHFAITFKQAVQADAEELASLRVEAMRESLERIGRFDPTRARERFLSGFNPEQTRHVLLSSANVGFVVVRPIETGLLLDHLYVKPACQGKGIGAAVLREVFAEARAVNCSVRVGALRESRSNQFYARHGFVWVEQAEFDNYYVWHASNEI
jgi:GNAT superfamily N-acetyltransferase